MKALVLGGTGFVGINLVDALLADGATVRVTRRKRSPTLLLRGRDVTFVEASLEDEAALGDAMRGVDAVYFAAGHFPRYSFDRDAAVAEGVRGVEVVCRAARSARVARVVYTSSVGPLAHRTDGRPADERDVPVEMPVDSTYRAVKWAMERAVDRAVAEGVPVVTLQPGGCVGPWDARAGTSALLLGVVRGLLPWWVDGTVNLVDVRDVALAHVRATWAEPGMRYCVAGHPVRVGGLFAHIAARFGGRLPTLQLSPEAARARADEDERRAAPHRQRVPFPRELVDLITLGQPVSSARACRDLGLSFRPLDEALDAAHAWFVRFKYLDGPAVTETHP